MTWDPRENRRATRPESGRFGADVEVGKERMPPTGTDLSEGLLTEDELQTLEATNTDLSRRYIKALLAENNLTAVVPRASLLSASGEGIDSQYGCPSGDTSRLHSNGAAKQYSSVNIQGGRTLYLYELGDEHYLVAMAEPIGIRREQPRRYLKGELETLVQQHFDVAASPQEKVTKLQNQIPRLSNRNLVNRLDSLREAGVRVIPQSDLIASAMMEGLFGVKTGPSVEARLKSAELVLTLNVLSERYQAIVEDASPETLRSYLIEDQEAGLKSPKLSLLVRHVWGPLHLAKLKSANDEQIRYVYWPQYERRIFQRDPAHFHLVKALIAKDLINREYPPEGMQ